MKNSNFEYKTILSFKLYYLGSIQKLTTVHSEKGDIDVSPLEENKVMNIFVTLKVEANLVHCVIINIQF